ncbi:MAG: hypothetical protein JSV12_07905 [Candidatus Bathyarchaeota archaeon]|nr:MAG: hypothetical protein JSV12_07905 [Candidatus Bathyarchaeota archaeon]
MIFDVLLPLILFLITLVTLFLYFRYEKRIGSVFKEVKFRYYHAILLVVATGIVVSVLMVIPGETIRNLYLGVYFLGFFLFTYLIVSKWYLAVLPPALFIALYFSSYWNLFTFNLFAILFAIFVSVYLGSLFTWKTTAAFVVLITVMDIVQVFITRYMVEASEKLVELGLPVMLIIPTFPTEGSVIGLGLGDVFLAGLLGIQTAKKHGKKFALASITAIAAGFLILQTVLLNYYPQAFPATVLVISGWLISLATRYIYKSSLLRHG